MAEKLFYSADHPDHRFYVWSSTRARGRVPEHRGYHNSFPMTREEAERLAGERRASARYDEVGVDEATHVTLVHAVKVGTWKWSPLGKAHCGCTISSRTPQTNDPAKVTCPRCLKRLAKALP